ncbi:MAG: hypothetical protein FWF60_02820 [Oscillospiraceae bacterium]|nr:hypothetical protein [Oscillospiraceae bacterium]
MDNPNNTGLAALGVRYAAEADKLEQMIVACKERRRFAARAGNSQESARQERLIELHTRQRADLLQLAAWMKHYYDGRAEDAR